MNKQIFKFMIVGASGTIVGLSLLYFLTDIFKLHYIISDIIATQCGIFNNFILNNFWTFKNNKNTDTILNRLFKYESVAIFGVTLNIIVTIGLTEIFHMYYVISAFLAVFVVFFVNYHNSKNIVWK